MSKSNAYRFDSRTQSQFVNNIKNAHIKEQEISRRLGTFLKRKTGQEVTIEANGNDMSGNFIEDCSKISHDPDFKINGKLVEITRSDPECQSVFHHKTEKIDHLIKIKSDLVFVNGYDNEYPRFIWLTWDQLKKMTEKAINTFGKVIQRDTSKLSYRYNLAWFNWETLPK